MRYSSWWRVDREGTDHEFLKGLLALNNEYAGLGYPTDMLACGIDNILMASARDPLFKELQDLNGSTATANGMQEAALAGQYSVDRLQQFEAYWMGENDARQRSFVSRWREGKWADQAKAAEEKKKAKEAKEQSDLIHSQTDIVASALNGDLSFPGFAGGAMAAGTSTETPGGKGSIPGLPDIDPSRFPGVTLKVGTLSSITGSPYYDNSTKTINLYSGADNATAEHEYGHYLQALIFGDDVFDNIISPASLRNSMLNRVGLGESHWGYWTERSANTLSIMFFGKNSYQAQEGIWPHY